MTSSQACWALNLGLLVPGNGNCNPTAYKDFLDTSVLLKLWQKSEEEPHLSVILMAI